MKTVMKYQVKGKEIIEEVIFVCYEKNDKASVVCDGELILVPANSIRVVKS